jgi:hypothetical protein
MSGEPEPRTLYLVATPIGNVEDLSPRARHILAEATVVAAEDTRHTRGLLARFGIDRALVSYHDHNKDARTPELVGRLREGMSVAVVSDAGSPGISDPAFTLVRAAVREDLRVVPIPDRRASSARSRCPVSPPTDSRSRDSCRASPGAAARASGSCARTRAPSSSSSRRTGSPQRSAISWRSWGTGRLRSRAN